MVPAHPAVTVALALTLPLLAGCTSPEPEEETLMQETMEVGERLYTWASEDFHSSREVGRTSTIRADFDTPGDIGDIGVGFAGRFEWTNISSAALTLTDPEGNEALRLNATEGNEDDFGPIHQFWSFNRVVPAAPGKWTIAMRGEGNIGPLDFTMHGIERRETINQRAFTVDDPDRAVTVRVFMNGYGATPELSLEHPNGTTEPIPVDPSGDEATFTFDPERGGYQVRAHTTGWGGNLAFQVKQAA